MSLFILKFLRGLAMIATLSVATLSANAELVAHYEFNEASGGASNAVNSGTGSNVDALTDDYGAMNGAGQLIVSADAGRVNTSLVSDVFGGTIFYRIDFNSWDTSGANLTTKFGFRLKSVGSLNKLMEVNLVTGTGDYSANINTSANGSYDYVQGGMANPQTNGVSFIIGVDTVSDTFSIWRDNGLTGTYDQLRSEVALSLGGETDFTQVNALTFDPGGGVFEIERIALGTDFYEIRALGNSGPPTLPDHLNVLLIVCDDLNDFEGVFGGHPQAQTPNIDALAASGVRFVNAHTNAPICGPSRSSFITGTYPHTSGIYGFGNWYNPGKSGFSVNTVLQNSKTLMHYMRDNGYQSYGTGKLMHYDLADDYVYPAGHPEAGNSQEFWDEYGAQANYGPVALDPNANGGAGVAMNHPSIPTTFYEGAGGLNSLFGSLANVPTVNGYTGWWKSGWLAAGAYNYVDDDNRDAMQDEEVRQWAVDKINALAASDPTGTDERFIMSVGFHNPHTPFVAPQAYFDLYPIETLELPPRIENDVDDTYFNQTQGPNTSTLKVYSSLVDSVGEASADGTLYATEEDFLKAYLQAYLACVSFVDAQIGALVEALDDSPYANNTVVILTSDHGYEWGEKEALSKNTLWENSTRVPLVIRVPGFDANDGKQVTVPVALVDLYPTVRDLCGLDADTKKTSQGADLDGHSMLPLLIDPDAGEWDGPPVALSMVSGSSTSEPESKNFAVRSADWRYIRYENGREELYCLNNDPYEFTNLIGSPNPVAQAKHAELAAELLTMVPELGSDTRNLLTDPGFEWLTDGSSPNAGDTPWETEEGSGNMWQITRGGSVPGASGKYALKFQQRWTSSPVTQLLSDALDSNLTYDVSFWMMRDAAETLGGSSNASVDIELWSDSDGSGDFVHRGNMVTAALNSVADVWQQFHGTLDASTLEAYDGEPLQLRIVRNDNVKQIIYLDDFVLDAYATNTFDHWAFENGLNPSTSGIDLDGDGLTALEEYAYGGDPVDGGSVGHASQVSYTGSSVAVTYPERKDSELIYQLEYSTDLQFWADGGFIQQTPVEQYGLDYWKAMGVMDTSAEKLFVRVKAEAPVVEADPSLPSAIYVPTGYAYVWGDRFGGNALDSDKWFVGMRDPDSGDLVPGAKGDYLLNTKYAGYVTEEDSYVESGSLVLQNQKRSYTGTSPSGNYQYTSGWVSSMHRGHFNKGYIEVRAKFPSGDKVWPAIWLVSEDLVWGPEWDLWEYFGYREDVGYDNMGMHLMTGYEQEGNLWPNQDPTRWDDTWLETFDADYDAESWHIFGWEWNDTYARWWVDGEVVHTLYKSDTKEPSAWPDEEMYIILNNGVRSASPDSTTTWPNQLVIDYIEVYQKQ
jgi:arylsulfatase A-like enzyme/beta-glucanase (GH16 family)